MICEYIKLKSDVRLQAGVEGKVLDYKNQGTLFPYKGTMIARNSEVCLLEGKISKTSFNLDMSFSDAKYQIQIWEQSNNFETAKSVFSTVGQMIKEKSWDAVYETMQPKIMDANGNQVGEFQYVPVKGEGLQSYMYNKLVLHGYELSIYTVGHGTKDISFCMYDANGQMVATVSKAMKVKNGKGRYTMYIANDDWFKYVAIATAIIHQVNYEGDDMNRDGVGLGRHGHALNTYQKELLNKYQPDFIQNIINSEDPSNLPENMPLVKQKVKESQNTFGLIFERIKLVILLVVILAIVLLLILS